MTIRDTLRKTIRGGHAYATVLASTTKTATVRTDSGQILAGLRVVGGPLSVGERVVIQWVSGNPTVYATGVAATVETSDASTSQTVLVREGTKDHGSLAGLDDDDHPQYVHLVNARTITAQHNFAPTSSAAPFLLGANARGVVVVGFRADELDNSVVAGAGLTGGGVLTGDVTLNVGAGDGIAVGANTVGLITPGTLSVSSDNDPSENHTHFVLTSNNPGQAAYILATDEDGVLRLNYLGVRVDPVTPLHVVNATEQFRIGYDDTNYASFASDAQGQLRISATGAGGGNILLAPGGDVVLDPAGKDVLPLDNYDVNLGAIHKKFLSIYAAEMWVETLVAQGTIATIGGRILVGPTTTLTRDLGDSLPPDPVGLLTIHPDDEHWFQRDGEGIFFVAGYYTGIGTLIYDNVDYEDFYKVVFDTLADNGITYYRQVMNMGQIYNGSMAPYARGGSGTYEGGGNAFDLDAFNQSFFDHWREVIEYAQSKGIIVQLCLLDSWHNKTAEVWTGSGGTWGLDYDFYASGNNVNGIGVTTHAQWHNTGHACYAYHVAFVEKAVDELGDLKNIVWEVSNENYVSDTWNQALAAVITARENLNGFPNHIVMPRDLNDHDGPGIDANQGMGKTWNPATAHSEVASLYPTVGSPMIADNDGGGGWTTPEETIDRVWGVLTAGGNVSIFDGGLDTVPEVTDPDVQEAMRYVGYVHLFIEGFEVDLRNMAPHDELVTSGWCLALPSERFIVYLPSGGTTTISGAPYGFDAFWFDPETGMSQIAIPTSETTFDAPDTNPWVLYLEDNGAGAPSGDIELVDQYTTGSEEPDTSITLTKPAGVQEDDFLLAQINTREDNAVTPPAGWTLLYENVNVGAGVWPHVYTGWFYRIATDSEPADYTFTSEVSSPISGGLTVWRGVDTDDPIDGMITNDNDVPFGNENDRHPHLDGYTTTDDNVLLIFTFGGDKPVADKSIVWSSLFVEQYLDGSSASGDNNFITMAIKEQVSPGATGEVVATVYDEGLIYTAGFWNAMLLGLRPDDGEGPVEEYGPTPSLVGSETAANGSDDTDLTIDVPAGVSDGDFLIAQVSVRGDDATITPPAGWTQLYHEENDGMDSFAALTTAIFYRVASSEPSDYTFTCDLTTSMSGGITAWSGVDTDDPFDGTTYNGNTLIGDSNSSPAVSGITTTADNVRLLFMVGVDAPTSRTVIPPSGFTEVYEDGTSYGGGTYGSNMNEVAHDEHASPGATGAVTGTIQRDGGNWNQYWNAFLIGLKPPIV